MENQPELDDSLRYIYWDSLHFIDPAKKDKYWAAQNLAFIHANSRHLISSVEVERARKASRGELDVAEYKQMIDPKTPDGEGGQAEYFVADWKANPMFVHLDNIVGANIENVSKGVFVKAADQYSKSKLQKENEKILTKKYIRNLINDINSDLGFPSIGKNEDPYTWINRMQAQQDAKSAQAGQQQGGVAPMSMIDSIKNAIEDDQDLALFNEYIYKDGVEIAAEIGITYYLDENKFERIAEKVVDDIKHFNLAAIRYYTSKTTGRPVFEYREPAGIMVSDFAKNDGSDIKFWSEEYDVSFSDFIRMFGAGIKKECLATNRDYKDCMRKIFEMNRKHGFGFYGHELDFDKCSAAQRDSAKIRIGYFEVESQDIEVYSSKTMRGNEMFKRESFKYNVTRNQKKQYNAKREEAYYNVWYKAYYIPYNTGMANLITTDFANQADFIFDFGKVQDQQREGDDFKYAKGSLILWRSKKISFNGIMSSFMPKINLMWLKFQNALVHSMPDGTIFANEVMNKMMSGVDDNAKSGKSSKFKMMRYLKQSGYAQGNLLDADGKPLNGGNIAASVTTGHLRTAEQLLGMMERLYLMLRQSLGQNDVSEGAGAKPRISLGVVQMSSNATNMATFFVEKAFIDMYLECCRRVLYYLKDIVEMDDTERMADFADVVGRANAMAMESIKDIPLHRLGVTVQNILTDEQKGRLIQIADALASSGQLDPDVAVFLSTIDNLKYAMAILRLKVKEKQREIAAQKQQQQQDAMQLEQAKLQTILAQINAKEQWQFNIADNDKKWDYRIEQLILGGKDSTLSKTIQERGQNKENEEVLKSNLRKQEKMEGALG